MGVLPATKYDELVMRIANLRSSSTPKWGQMSVEEMLVHCSAGIRLAFGDLPFKRKIGPFRAAVLRIIFLELLPFPKSARSPAEININKKLKTRMPFEEGRTDLLRQLARIVEVPSDYTFAAHPFFLDLSHRQWGKLAYKHLDHHLRQFGV